jgi:hypothetical protein
MLPRRAREHQHAAAAAAHSTIMHIKNLLSATFLDVALTASP